MSESREHKVHATGRNRLVACATAAATVLVAMLALGWSTTPVSGNSMSSMPCALNSDPSASIFSRFRNDDGCVQSAPAFATVGTTKIDASNAFFTPGPNGQSCATCHRPGDGMTVHVTTILNAFEASSGNDPLFRLNDTANRPDADVSTVDARRNAYSLTLALGVTRIDKTFPANPEFVVAAQTTDKFGTLPAGAPGPQTLALFRRPLVDTNMRFDSGVLWDGRQSITNLRGQVKGAAKALLLNPSLTDAEADDIARFQLSVFTDQVIDDRDSFPESHAGDLSAERAKGGVRNLVHRAFNSESPCLFTDPRFTTTAQLTHTVTPNTPTYFPNDGTGSLTPSSCEEVEQGGHNMTTFRAWLNLSGDSDPNLSRRRIAHGEEIFNRAVLHVPPDIVIPGLEQEEGESARAHCTTCHATNNIGNHPDGDFFVRIGSDSVQILQELADAHPETPSLQDFVTRTAMLPQYCLRSTMAGAPPLPGAGVTGVNCGDYKGDKSLGIPADTVTSDPGRAMVTGKWADIGKFKPPILRGLATRSPYFHGSAADSTVGIIDFYNARFNIGLSDDEKQDLVRFVEAH